MEKVWGYIRRQGILNLGLFIIALGIIFTLQAGLGLSSWDVLHNGLSRLTPLSFGQASQVTGIVMIGVALLLKEKLGIGTLLNMVLIGLWVDIMIDNKVVPDLSQYGIGIQLTFLLISLGFFGFGSGLYTKASLGVGPRDSVMLALVRITGWRVAIIRTLIESCAVIVGWAMGGTVGFGTLLVAIGMGPAVEIGFKLCGVKVRRHKELVPEFNEAI